jgi:hypothetical protein
MRMDADRLIRQDQAKQQQKKSRTKSTLRGSAGRVEHKHKARSTQKPYGGKDAR